MRKIFCVGLCLVGMVLLSLVCSASALPAESLALAAVQQSRTEGINMNLKNVSVKAAADALFKLAGANYTLNPGYVNHIIDLSINNAKFADALDAFCRAADLTCTKSGDIYVLSARQKQDDDDSLSAAIKKMDELAGVVTVEIPEMNLREAISKVSPEEAQRRQPTEATSPQASFYRFPQEMAINMLVAKAAGNPTPIMDIKAITRASAMVPISVGAYKASTGPNAGQWMLTVFANQADAVELLSAMFRVSRTPFILTGVENKPGSATWAGKADGSGKTITAQIFDTPLDQAVNMIAASADLEIGYVSPNGLIPSEGMTYTIKPKKSKAEAVQQSTPTQDKGKSPQQ